MPGDLRAVWLGLLRVHRPLAHLEEGRRVHFKPIGPRLVHQQDGFGVVLRQLGVEQGVSEAGGLRLRLRFVLEAKEKGRVAVGTPLRQEPGAVRAVSWKYK